MRQTEDAEEAWLCCGDRQQGRIAIVTATDGHFSMEVPSSDVGADLQNVIPVMWTSDSLPCRLAHVSSALDMSLQTLSSWALWTSTFMPSTAPLSRYHLHVVFHTLPDLAWPFS